MCRKNQLLAFCLIAFGIGVVVGSSIESVFWSSLWGFGAIAAGLLVLLKRQV